jgi:biotin carboxyl carrier protein
MSETRALRHPKVRIRSAAVKVHIELGGKVYEVEYDAADDMLSSSARPAAAINREQSIVLPTPRDQSADANGIDESKVFRNPVAGIVTRIDVESGQLVQEGETLMVVEAMKMENSLAASGSARVASVRVKVGETVKVGQIAIEFE